MSTLITIKDKSFKPLISEQKIAEAVRQLAEKINRDFIDKNPLFVAVLNGSFIFAADLLREITIPCEISFVKLASYEGMTSKGAVTELIGLGEDLTHRTVIIVEDIVDSGITVARLKELLNSKNVKEIKVATILFKPEAFKKDIAPEYVGFSIKNDFVVGYGLDYQGLGRNLKEIHVIA